MASYNKGKKFVCNYLMETFNVGDKALDVGACDGKWYKLLSPCFKMDAIEAFKPNILKHKLLQMYDNVYNVDVCDFDFENTNYDIIVMGDILEHIETEKAQALVEKIYPKCKELLIAVPYKYKQEAIYDNPYEEHKQDDLTHELFMERYKGFKVLWQDKKYGYYIKAN